MGHNFKSKVFAYYRPEVSNFDIQSARHETKPEEVTTFSSVSLGAVQSAPTSLSRLGHEKISHHPDVIAANQRVAEELEKIVAKYGPTCRGPHWPYERGR